MNASPQLGVEAASAADVPLVFPVLAFDRLSFEVKASWDQLTIVWMCIVKSGWFDSLRIADARGQVFDVARFSILGGVGPLWGLDPRHPFLGRRVRVSLELRRVAATDPVNDIRDRLLRQLNSWGGWESRDDIEELRAAIRGGRSIPELISRLASFNV